VVLCVPAGQLLPGVGFPQVPSRWSLKIGTGVAGEAGASSSRRHGTRVHLGGAAAEPCLRGHGPEGLRGAVVEIDTRATGDNSRRFS
jgi:hypothetical protein